MAMRHYRVTVNGENFLLNVEEELRRVGFYTVRYVEASDDKAAELAAVQMLRTDPKLSDVKNPRQNPPVLYAAEVEPISSAEVPEVQPGLVFYPESDDA